MLEGSCHGLEEFREKKRHPFVRIAVSWTEFLTAEPIPTKQYFVEHCQFPYSLFNLKALYSRANMLF